MAFASNQTSDDFISFHLVARKQRRQAKPHGNLITSQKPQGWAGDHALEQGSTLRRNSTETGTGCAVCPEGDGA
jgi:hypothetical protein